MVRGGVREAWEIQATNVSTGEQETFSSVNAACKRLARLSDVDVKHWALKRSIQREEEAHGFVWKRINPPPSAVDDDPPVADRADDDDNVFTFREGVEAIFLDGKVRVTDETPRRASVFDVIRVVTGLAHPRTVYASIQAAHGDIMTHATTCFPGQGQRETPVVDTQGLTILISLLPGHRAARFRVLAARILCRYLAGDRSLHAEIDAHTARQARLPAHHPMQIYSETAYAHPKNQIFRFSSSQMEGKFIGEYYNQPLVYLLDFEHGGKQYVKVGWTDDLRERMNTHFRELPGCQLYSAVVVDNPFRLEKRWKDDFRPHNEVVTINDRNKTELFTGITLEDAESHLFELASIVTESSEIQKLRLQHELELKRLDLEMKRLDLQILQARAHESSTLD